MSLFHVQSFACWGNPNSSGAGAGLGEGRCMGLLFRAGERDSRLNVHWKVDFLPIPRRLECLYSGRLMCPERCKYRCEYHHIIHVTVPTRGWDLLWVCSKITEQSLFSTTVSRLWVPNDSTEFFIRLFSVLLLLATGTRLLITGRWNQVCSPSQHAGFVKKLCEQTFWLVSDNLLEVCVYAPHS